MLNQIFFLRKNRNFNKSRYARNRQTTRVAFYFSLLVNIIVIFSVFTLYYKFLFKLALLWWPFYIFLLSFFLGSFLRISVFFNYIVLKKILIDAFKIKK